MMSTEPERQESLPGYPQPVEAPQPTPQEKYNALRAQQISHKWGDRLDDFRIPCPLCSGDLQLQGSDPEHYFEFAEGELGVIYPVDALSLSFICNRCGYVAVFDGELFNPAYIAQLEGASPDELQKLVVSEYRVLVSLTGKEKTNTLLDLATALAGELSGEVRVIATSSEGGVPPSLEERLQRYSPQIGDPAPIQLLDQINTDIGEELRRTSSDQRCDLLMLDGHDWANARSSATNAVNHLLETSICDVAIVYDRGLQDINQILLATSGGENARAAATLAVPLAHAYGARLHVLYVASPNHPNWREEGQKVITDTLQNTVMEGIHIERRVVTNADFVEAVVESCGSYDLLIMGASTPKLTHRHKKTSASVKIARNSSVTSVMVHARQSLFESWLNRLFR
ncbi:MAG: universal stress protein [Anaerolineae bacterium]